MRASKTKALRRELAAAVAALLICGGCSGASVEQLLSPPRLDGEQTEIYNALRTYTNDDIILKYPRSGQYRSAFVVRNLDNEYSDEAIVFYEMPNISDGSSLRMNFLDRQNGKWVSVYDFAAAGSEVESITFKDLGNGSTTIVVTYLVQSTSDRSTSIMQYKGGRPLELLTIRNISNEILDADGDGHYELFTVSADRTTGNAFAGIYGWVGDKFTMKGTAALNSGFAGIKNISGGLCCDGEKTQAVFIDYASSDGYGGTDAVIWGDKYFYLSPALTPNTLVRTTNSYTPYISCGDPDNDGFIEIPASVPFPGYTDSPVSEQINMTVWYSLIRSGTSCTEKFRSFVGTKGDYVLIFPEKWHDKLTASASISEGTVTFTRFFPATGTLGKTVLTLYSAAEGSTSKYDSDEYFFLGKSSSTGYSYYAQSGDAEIALSYEELKELFILQ